MASTHPYKVALHCNDKEPVEVNNLATNVIAQLTLNAAAFVTSTMPLTAITALIATLTTANNKLTGYIAGAPGNHTVTTQRNSQTVIVYNMLNTSFRNLVDSVALGVKATVELSGFDATSDATAHVIPDIPVISKITDVKQPDGHAKIILVKKKKKKLTGVKPAKSAQKLKYSARITNTPVTATSVWTTELSAVIVTRKSRARPATIAALMCAIPRMAPSGIRPSLATRKMATSSACRRRLTVRQNSSPSRRRSRICGVKPVGEWNTFEVTARGRTLTLWVNGAVTCQFDNCGQPRGHIGVEGEGYRIEFRNLKVKELR